MGTFPAMRFRMLGGFDIVDGVRTIDPLSPKQRTILAALLLHRDRTLSVDRLIDIAWGDPSDSVLSSLHSHVSRLRNVLEPDRLPRQPPTVLLTQPPGYRLVVARDDVDAYRFEDEVDRGLERLHAGALTDAVAAFDAALAAWTGPLLPEFADEPFAIAAAERIEHARLAALEGAADAHLRLGAHRAAVQLLEREAREQRPRERMQWLLALGLYRSDRQTDALRVIDRCRRALLDTSGLNLGTDLRELEAAMLAQDPALTLPAARHGGPGTAESAVPVNRPADAAADAGHHAARSTSPATGERTTLIGRSQEARVLDDAVAAAQAGRGGCALIVGEPGIGKTRLAESVVDRAAELGIVTAWARCPESRSAPPFWPLTQLGEQLRAAGFTDLQVRELDRQGAATEVSERFGFYRAVLDAIADIDLPLVLVIDDLQWADPDSLRLLEQLASELRSMPTLLVATLRPVADDDAHPGTRRLSGRDHARARIDPHLPQRPATRRRGRVARCPPRRDRAARGRRARARADRRQPAVHQRGDRAARRRGTTRIDRGGARGAGHSSRCESGGASARVAAATARPSSCCRRRRSSAARSTSTRSRRRWDRTPARSSRCWSPPSNSACWATTVASWRSPMCSWPTRWPTR